MKIIGLTGGIGTGKSTVSAYLRNRGIPILDADELAREIVKPGSPILLHLVEAFGEDVLCSDGTLNRKKLGAQVFADPVKKEKLDGMMHGEIMACMTVRLRQFEQQGTPMVVIDAPLLLETGLKDMVETIWLVDVDECTQLKRVKQRDGLSDQEILDRIGSQMPRKEKRKMAHVIIDNSGKPEDLYAQVEELLHALRDDGGKGETA